MTVAFQEARRAVRNVVTISVVGGLLLGGVLVVLRTFHVGPLFHLKAPHLPALTHTTHGPSVSTIILDHLQAIGHVHAEDATYTWGQAVSGSHQFLGVTTSTYKHQVSLVAKVPVDVDVSAAAYSIPAPNQLVLYFPPPVPGSPTIDPASQQQIDSCANHWFAPLTLSQSCPADPLKYQEQAVAAIIVQSQHDAAVIDAARVQTAQLVACLVQPTGWDVMVEWTDQPNLPRPFVAQACPLPLTQRLAPLTPTTGAP